MENINIAVREAEKAIITAILNNHVKPADTGLIGTEFNIPDFREIFLGAKDLLQEHSDIDFVSLSNYLQQKKSEANPNPPSPSVLANLAVQKVSLNLRPCIDLLNQISARSKLKDLFTQAATWADDLTESPTEIIARTETLLNPIRDLLGSKESAIKHISEIQPLAQMIYDELLSGISHNIPTGLTIIDSVTGGGGAPGDVWVIGAFTGGGKSSLALFMARHQSSIGINSLIISREMLDLENFKRLHCAESGVPNWRIKPKMGTEIYQTLTNSIDQVSSQRIWLDSKSSDMASISASIREAVKNFGVKVIYVDYLQLLEGIKGTKMTRADEVAYCSRTLKRLAMETETFVVSLAQYNRMASYAGQAENHSFAESSAIEKDASITLHLELEKMELKPGEYPPKWRKATIRIGKGRNAPQTQTEIWYRGETFTFSNESPYALGGHYDNH